MVELPPGFVVTVEPVAFNAVLKARNTTLALLFKSWQKLGYTVGYQMVNGDYIAIAWIPTGAVSWKVSEEDIYMFDFLNSVFEFDGPVNIPIEDENNALEAWLNDDYPA